MTEYENDTAPDTQQDNVDVAAWKKKLESAEARLEKEYYKQAEDALAAYGVEQDKRKPDPQRFPIFWSNTQVLGSALYSQSPQPEIRKRNSDSQDPLHKSIVQVLERAITYQIDTCDFDTHVVMERDEFLVTGLGVVRVEFDAETQIVPDPMTGEPIEVTVPGSEKITPKHWHFKRFLWDCAKDWEECEWVCYKHYQTSKEIKRKYKQAPLDLEKDKGKHCVYEIWDKSKRRVIVIMDQHDKPLEVKPDPLKLVNFFDCPKPLFANCRTDKLIPKPDFFYIKDQVCYINKLQRRIDSLTDQIKDAGFYDASIKELKDLSKCVDGTLIPVANMLERLQGTALDNVIAKLPIEQTANVLLLLEERREKAKEQIYEITGLSDIVRGASKASETATAQQLKGQWANVRLARKQSAINEQLRQMLRIYAEIIAEMFLPESLTAMTGVEVTPDMAAIMKNDLMRGYAIDVETDSTIARDEQEEKQGRLDMVNQVLGVINAVLPAIQQGMMPADIGKELLLTTVRGFKYARNLEDMIQGLDGNMEQMQALQQQMQQMQQQYEEQLMQANQQMGQMQQQMVQMDQQLQQVNEREEQRKDVEVQGEAMKDQADAEYKRAQALKTGIEAQTIGQQPVLLQPPGVM